MKNTSNRHKNYELLNLIGYGLAKFDKKFIAEFGFKTKSAFFDYCVNLGVAETIGTVKNRMDLFDHFFPENGRKGWWQKGDAYIHRKIFIDSLFGNESSKDFANIVKLSLENFSIEKGLQIQAVKVSPIIVSRYKQLQKTGLQAELYFLENYHSIDFLKDGIIVDARLYGDGYDFEVEVNKCSYLAEVKGIREKKGKLRLTEKEYQKAKEYKDDYILTVVSSLNYSPVLKTIKNPIKNLVFEEKEIFPKARIEYHLANAI